jgi:hypothetical protein
MVFLWAVLGVVWALTDLGGILLIRILGASPEAIMGTATFGVTTVSIPIVNKVESTGLPQPVGIFLVNGTACLVLFLLPFAFHLQDATRRDRPPRFLRRMALRSPTLFLWNVFPSFRKIPSKELRIVYENLAVLPVALPVVMGCILGGLTASLILPGREIASTLLVVSFLLPHGILELSAFFFPMACIRGLFADVRPDLEAGRVEAVWETMRARIAPRPWILRFVLAEAMLAAAAAIESYGTLPIAKMAASWLDLQF